MQVYDVIITLGNGFTDNWGVPATVENRLRSVAYLYNHKVSNKILLSGGYSISWDVAGIKPPTTEALEMKKMLLTFGVPESALFLEEQSKDTISNFYFSKVNFLKPNNWKNILVVCTDIHLRRVKFLSKKILGPEYNITYQTTPSHSMHDQEFLEIQDIVFDRQNLFLKDMNIGDDSFLENKLFNDPYYKTRRPELVSEFSMKGVR